MSNCALGLAVVVLALVLTPRAGLSTEMSSPTHSLTGGSFSAAAASNLELSQGAGIGGGSALIGEAGLAGDMIDGSGAALSAGYFALTAQAVVCGNGTLDPGEACDDGGTIPGDGCWATCESENALAFMGIAVGGFRIELTVNGVPIFIVTRRGESSADIAQRTADAINSEIQDANALAVGPQVFTNGVLTDLLSLDPGISLGAGLPVPAVSGWGLVLLGLMLCSVCIANISRDGRTRQHGWG